MADMDQIDLFTSVETTTNPIPYMEYLRSKGKVVQLPGRNIVAVTDYDAGMGVLRDTENFSSVIVFGGPLLPTDFTPAEDLTDQIEQVRPHLPGGDTIITADMPEHGRVKSLLMGVFTPKRVKENEGYIRELADEQILKFIDNGKAELLTEFGRPVASATVGHLLGVPREDLSQISYLTDAIAGGVNQDAADIGEMINDKIRNYFMARVKECRENPGTDIMSDIANTRYADGSLPPAEDVAALGVLLFAAGEDTASRAIIGAVRWVAEDAELQARLRADPSLIPGVVEEVLRLDGPGLAIWRMAKRRVTIGDNVIEPGTFVGVMQKALNRDPARFANPSEFDPQRANFRDHVSFGRGIHACPGAPVARAEIKVSIERLLAHTSSITIDESVHGPAGARRYDRLPSYFVQGLLDLHIKFVKA